MKLKDYLSGISAATSVDALQKAIEVGYIASTLHSSRRTSKAIVEAGRRICTEHPLGKYIPRLLPRNKISVLGQEYSMGYAGNSAGSRYLWAYAEEWFHATMKDTNLKKITIQAIWDRWYSHPHRCLKIIEDDLNLTNSD